DKPKLDPGSDAVLGILDGKAPLRVEAHWKEDILAVLGIAKAKKVRCVLLGASEAWRCIDEIKEVGAMVVLGPAQRFGGNRLDALRARSDVARLLAEADVPIAFMTAGAVGYRYDCAPLLAALAVSEGLSEADALRALTTGAAKIMGMEKHLGRLATGHRAAVQILTGRPFDPETSVDRMVIGDRVIDVAEGTR
ncbi:MAG: hypothetical protein CMJ83_19100, partial [Planctomycetes bacterium]|nr:hypothetical protein [Planctomycetota bacterium]